MGFGKKRGRKEDSTEFERRRLTASATFLVFRILGGFEQPITELKTKFDKFVNSRAGTVIEVIIANQCSHWCGPFQGFPPVTIRISKAFPHGEGGSRVSRKRETDEGLCPEGAERFLFALSVGFAASSPFGGAKGRRIVTGGNPWKGPHQSADWFAMTCVIRNLSQCGNAYFVIFSCLTLWSMICRLASSVRISSTEMPSSTISTSTW